MAPKIWAIVDYKGDIDARMLAPTRHLAMVLWLMQAAKVEILNVADDHEVEQKWATAIEEYPKAGRPVVEEVFVVRRSNLGVAQ